MVITGRVKVFALSFALLLTSCTTLAPPSTPTKTISWSAREAQLKNIHQFDIKGKIAVRTTQDSGSATIHWLQNGDNYTISIFGPLGSDGMTLHGRPGSVTMELANGKKVSANNAETLLAQQWGYHLPVSYLKYWIRGLPAPGADSQKLDQYNRITSLSQAGWQVEFLTYTNQNGIEVPQKINVTSADLVTKLVIYNWEVR